MTRVGEIVQECRRLGIELVAAGDWLRFRPAAAVTPELRAMLFQHKAELLAALSGAGSAGAAVTVADGTLPRDPTDLPTDFRGADAVSVPKTPEIPENCEGFGDKDGQGNGNRDAGGAVTRGDNPGSGSRHDGATYESATGYVGPADLPSDWRGWYEERAAIIEFCGNQPRERAEAAALAEVLAEMSARVTKPELRPGSKPVSRRAEPPAMADPIGAAAAEFDAPLSVLRNLRKSITVLCGQPAGTWLREEPERVSGPRQAMREAIKTLKEELERWRPATPCHVCGQDGTTENKGRCKRCLGTGWLPAASVKRT